MRDAQQLRTSASKWRIALVAASSGILAAIIGFGTLASAGGPNGQQRRPVATATIKKPVAAPVAPPVAPTPTTSGLLHGVYVGAADPSGVAAFGAATKTSVSIASEYLPSSSGWAGMDGANGGLD